MTGNFGQRVKEIKEFFKKNDIIPHSDGFAVDLGSGHGIQSAALLELGFSVTAVDFNEQLLGELKQNLTLKVRTVNKDISNYAYSAENKPELIICMGDTLTHLARTDEVKKLIENAASNLVPGGKFVISYRDMSTELKGTARFIPVKSDDNRILTCFLEYNDDCVNVNDILYEKVNDKWIMSISSYPKLRLAKETVYRILESSGLTVILKTDITGMHYIVSQKQK